MFSFMKSFTSVVLGATSVLSLTINAPSSPQAGTSTTITWTSTSTDPTFTIELFHPSFNQALAIANNVDPSLNQLTVTIPIVPAGDQYTLEAVNITNINQAFATSSDFSIAAAASPSPSASTPSVTTSGTTVSGASVPPTVTPTGSASAGVSSATSPGGSSVNGSGPQSAASSGASSTGSGAPSGASSLAPLRGAAYGGLLALGIAFITGALIL
ncbi:hypothetical protein DFH09DRAFT_1175419 [Mycena vulgaris]|nr:hypothetical protein DFH09DRAFT_1175419 [Mycena vulgaris]